MKVGSAEYADRAKSNSEVYIRLSSWYKCFLSPLNKKTGYSVFAHGMQFCRTQNPKGQTLFCPDLKVYLIVTNSLIFHKRPYLLWPEFCSPRGSILLLLDFRGWSPW